MTGAGRALVAVADAGGVAEGGVALGGAELRGAAAGRDSLGVPGTGTAVSEPGSSG